MHGALATPYRKGMEEKLAEVVDIARGWLKQDGQLLPVWILKGGHIGAGDRPVVYDKRATAKRMAGRQARIQGQGTEAFIVERREGVLYAYSAGRWTSSTRQWSSDPQSWKEVLHRERVDGQQPLWSVAAEAPGPRSRPSALAERERLVA